MGMGDKKKAFTPYHKKYVCVSCGNEYVDTVMRKCPHPAVVKAGGGKARVCMYCCRRKPCVHYAQNEWGGSLCTLDLGSE